MSLSLDEFADKYEYCMECLSIVGDDLEHFPNCPNKEDT